MRLLVVVVLVLSGCATVQQDTALCHTDSECQQLCPPQDSMCDGGPDPSPSAAQQVWDAFNLFGGMILR